MRHGISHSSFTGCFDPDVGRESFKCSAGPQDDAGDEPAGGIRCLLGAVA